MANRVAEKQTFIIMCASGCMKNPTWEKVGRGFWGPEGLSKAKEKASKMAEKDGSKRFYVFSAIRGYRKAPAVETCTYD